MGNKIGASLCGQVTFVQVPIIGLGAFDKLDKCLQMSRTYVTGQMSSIDEISPLDQHEM